MAFLTKSLPRRTLLRGLGTTMALPFLEAMLPPFSLSAKTVSKPVHRFQTFYVPNGMAMEYWSPKSEGSKFEITPHSGAARRVPRSDARVVGHQSELELHSRRRLRIFPHRDYARRAQ
jgi:hypothetical protein